jgi:hypothetical protein
MYRNEYKNPKVRLLNNCPLQCLEFLNTKRKARKKIQYNIAANNKITAQKKTPRKYNRKIRTIENNIHKRIERIIPPIPSPTAGPSKSKLPISGVLSDNFLILSFVKTFPILSFNLSPEYNPKLIKRKKEIAKIEVDRIEF